MKKKYNKKISGPLDRIKEKKRERKKNKERKKRSNKTWASHGKTMWVVFFFFSNIHSKEALLNHQV